MLALRPGDVFGSDFRIVRELGRGGMGAVYVVDQLSTGKQRALKLMNPGLIDDDKSRARFVLEARVGANVRSDHVIEVIAAGVEHGRVPWLAMELLEGETLDDAVRRAPLSPARARVVFEQLCHALGAAHAAGLVHRDVKPDNVFLATSRSPGMPVNVKLLDFGIAKLIQPTVEGAGRTGAVGTPLFMAPEQTRAGPIDARADVWALGLLAFHALCGRHYWRTAQEPGAPLTGLLMEVLADPFEPASVRAAEHGAQLPDGFDAWFARCVNRSLEERFADASATWDALHRVFRGEAARPFAATMPATRSVPPSALSSSESARLAPVTSAPPAQTTGSAAPPSRLPWAIAGAAVFGLVAVALSLAWTRTAEPTPTSGVHPAIAVEEVIAVDTSPSPLPEAPAEPVPEAPTEPAASAPAVVPEEAPVETPSPEAVPSPPPRRPATHSPADRRTIANFERLTNQACQMWLIENRRERQVIRITQQLGPGGSMNGWTVRPDDLALRQCLARSGANAPWTGTGQAREVRFRFVLRRRY